MTSIDLVLRKMLGFEGGCNWAQILDLPSLRGFGFGFGFVGFVREPAGRCWLRRDRTLKERVRVVEAVR